MADPDRARGAPMRNRYARAGGQPGHANHLVDASSPYLLQHAHNPVDWYPWGDAAFAKARREDKPVFLSIGYSTCHWCHVMAEESFEDEQVAAVLNRDFVAVKVDREQRPDLDEIYMTATTLMSGRGGWPMSCFLTPAGKPFFGATYFPREQFLALLEQVRGAWQTRRRRLLADADKLDEGIRGQLAPMAGARLPHDLIDRAAAALIEHADPVWGGFGAAPKFPQEPNLLFLLGEVARDSRALAAQPIWTSVCRALDAMLAGGIHDQIGGGFHRYATDREWRIPHFEKMLYNQGQLARVYTRAWQIGGQARYRRVTEGTLDYVLREMRAPDGGFYSATDADSEGVEGRYFVWRYAELAELLEPDALGLCEQVFGVTPAGNFDGANVLYQPRSLAAAAAALDTPLAALEKRVAAIRERLYQARRQRAAPLRDDKLITQDNATTIAALAEAGRALGRADYVTAAARAAHAILARHHDQPARRLWRTSLYGVTSAPAQLDDYVHLIDALIALYDATVQRCWLARARMLLDEARLHFLDTEGGGFFGAPAQTDGPQLLRGKPLLDGATISGNSLLLPVLVALDARTADADLAALIEQQIDAFSGLIGRAPLAGPVFLLGLRQRASPTPAALQYIAGGAIRAVCEAETVDADTVRVALTLEIAAGWHIQAHDAEPRVATRLAIANPDAWQRLSADYPPGQREAEADPPAAPVLAGRVVIEAAARRLAPGPLRLALQVQPCTQRECLPAAHVEFVVHHLA